MRANTSKIDNLKVSLDLAKLETVQSSLQFTGSIELPRLIVPAEIELWSKHQPHISWQDNTAREGPNPEGCIEAFLQLTEATDDEVLGFCKKWGVLAVEKQHRVHVGKVDYGLRAAEWENLISPAQDEELNDAILQTADWNAELSATIGQGEEEQSWYAEPSNVYRIYARQLKAFLVLSTDVFEGKQTQPQDWQVAMLPKKPKAFQWPVELQPQPDLDIQRHFLSLLVTEWINKIGTYPRLRWEGSKRPVVGLDGARRYKDSSLDQLRKLRNAEYSMLRSVGMPDGDWINRQANLFTVLTLQMVAMLTTQGGIYRCDLCGQFFNQPERKPRSDKKRYCGKDCKDEAHREVVRQAYKKKNASLQTAQEN